VIAGKDVYPSGKGKTTRDPCADTITGLLAPAAD
jgi:hypothetical protein